MQERNKRRKEGREGGREKVCFILVNNTLDISCGMVEIVSSSFLFKLKYAVNFSMVFVYNIAF